MNNDTLVVAYATDDNYTQHVGVSITSLLENNKQFKQIIVYIIDNGISQDGQEKLTEIIKKYNREIKLVNFSLYEKKLNLNIRGSIAITSYARLFLGSIIEDKYNKVIYLDSDSVILGQLDELWNTDIEEYYIGGVKDTVSHLAKIKIGLLADDMYVNAGMLLINLKKWRDDNIENKFIDFIEKYNGNVFHHDQGTINGVCRDKILPLHPKFNCNSNFYSFTTKEICNIYNISDYYSQGELDDAIENPIFLHYTPGFFNRPWMENCKHPKHELYQEYLYLTSWKEKKLIKDNRNWKIKLLSVLHHYLPKKIFLRIYKRIENFN